MPESEPPGRRSIRLQGYDYSQAGGYFVTVVAQLRQNFFGEIRGDEMCLNEAGIMVQSAWQSLPERFRNIDIDVFQVMPNHFHGILFIHTPHTQTVGAGLVPARDPNNPQGQVPPHARATTRVAPTGIDENPRKIPALGDIVGGFKSITTHEYILGVDRSGWPQFHKRLWQRNYYEHILRDQGDYEQKAGYILSNPSNWGEDEEHP